MFWGCFGASDARMLESMQRIIKYPGYTNILERNVLPDVRSGLSNRIMA